MNRCILTVIAAAVIGVSGQCLRASTANYGSLTGTDYAFKNIVENSITDPLPLFGSPTVDVNTLRFTPANYISSVSGLDVDTTDSQLSLEILSNAGRPITTVGLKEQGIFQLIGDPGAYMQASLSAPVWVQVLKVNGTSINPVTIQGNIVFSPAHIWTSAGSGAWTGSLVVDVTAGLRSGGIASGYATDVNVTLDDVLSTEGDDGTSVLLAKTQADISVPEPATLALISLGILAIRARRKIG